MSFFKAKYEEGTKNTTSLVTFWDAKIPLCLRLHSSPHSRKADMTMTFTSLATNTGVFGQANTTGIYQNLSPSLGKLSGIDRLSLWGTDSVPSCEKGGKIRPTFYAIFFVSPRLVVLGIGSWKRRPWKLAPRRRW
ncbi:hypothetical protein AVEN_251844-1 [Araneus ventricosus]|uniref:Uncharacterized protein n=1 Tax=Araneus ventricosus TaxID=182803 RepID=A0A4Y2FXI6_ARAVE|nr:hypothetical protein AVEN_251844-1 [Araneus ventricosus]